MMTAGKYINGNSKRLKLGETYTNNTNRRIRIFITSPNLSGNLTTSIGCIHPGESITKEWGLSSIVIDLAAE